MDDYLDDPQGSVQTDLQDNGYGDALSDGDQGGMYTSAPSTNAADYAGADRLAAIMDSRSKSALEELKAARARATASLTAPADKSAMWLAAAGALLSPTRYGGTFADSVGKASEAVAPFAQRNADQRTLVNRMLAEQDMNLANAQYAQSLRPPTMSDIYTNGGKQKVAIIPGVGPIPIGGALRTQRLSQAEQIQLLADQQHTTPAAIMQQLHPQNRTTINMPPEESQFNKTLGEGEAKQVNGLIQSSQDAPMKIAQMQRLTEMLQQIKTGRWMGSVADFQKGLSSIGIDPAAYGMRDIRAVNDAIAPMTNALALQFRNTAGGAGMPGSMSDKDREFLTAMIPNIETTPEAVPLMTNYFIKMEKRQAEIGAVIDNYRSQHGGRVDPQVLTAVRQYNEAHPIFDQNDIDTLRQITGHAPHGATTNNPNDLQGFE